jgi:hypothetical protein
MADLVVVGHHDQFMPVQYQHAMTPFQSSAKLQCVETVIQRGSKHDGVGLNPVSPDVSCGHGHGWT